MDQDKEEILRGLDLVEKKADSKLKPAFDQVNQAVGRASSKLISRMYLRILGTLSEPWQQLDQ